MRRVQPTRMAHDIETWWGAGSVDRLFGDHAMVLAPWPAASRSKHRPVYDPEVVAAAMQRPQWVQPSDPRRLRATQPWVTRAGVSHYLAGTYERTGNTFADRHSATNRFPIVWVGAAGRCVILTGHHRSAAALVLGRSVWVRLLPRTDDPPYRSVTTGLHVGRGVEGVAVRSPVAAAARLRRFEPAAVASDEAALDTLVRAGTSATVAADAIRHSHRGSGP